MSRSKQQHPPEAWAPVRRAAAAITSPIQQTLAIEAASGVVLLVATVVALIWANLWTLSYTDLWHTPIGGRIGPWSYEQPLHFWVNDGLMTIFFFVVGLEIRREIFEGELASLRKAALPLAAAVGGMLAPAVIFAALNAGRDGAPGWAIPMATDIAFAVGVLTLLGSRVPAAWRVLLLALAVIDDIGAILVIAIFYSTGISLYGLAVVHPTIAGVLLGLVTPARSWFGPSGFAAATQAQLERIPEADRHELLLSLDRVEQARREAVSPVERLIHALHPWVAFVIMPIFALANAGVVLSGARLTGDYVWLFGGVVAGLAIGKPLGIAAASLGATKIKIAARSDDMTGRGILLVGLVGGIGFTMSLFIAQLAFRPGPLLDTAKLAILVGSGVAIFVGLAFGAATLRKRS
jgi:NhaA family Na+:H+ antiporter